MGVLGSGQLYFEDLNPKCRTPFHPLHLKSTCYNVNGKNHDMYPCNSVHPAQGNSVHPAQGNSVSSPGQ